MKKLYLLTIAIISLIFVQIQAVTTQEQQQALNNQRRAQQLAIYNQRIAQPSAVNARKLAQQRTAAQEARNKLAQQDATAQVGKSALVSHGGATPISHAVVSTAPAEHIEKTTAATTTPAAHAVTVALLATATGEQHKQHVPSALDKKALENIKHLFE